jgi:hypothetical protein
MPESANDAVGARARSSRRAMPRERGVADPLAVTSIHDRPLLRFSDREEQPSGALRRRSA